MTRSDWLLRASRQMLSRIWRWMPQTTWRITTALFVVSRLPPLRIGLWGLWCCYSRVKVSPECCNTNSLHTPEITMRSVMREFINWSRRLLCRTPSVTPQNSYIHRRTLVREFIASIVVKTCWNARWCAATTHASSDFISFSGPYELSSPCYLMSVLDYATTRAVPKHRTLNRREGWLYRSQVWLGSFTVLDGSFQNSMFGGWGEGRRGGRRGGKRGGGGGVGGGGGGRKGVVGSEKEPSDRRYEKKTLFQLSDWFLARVVLFTLGLSFCFSPTAQDIGLQAQTAAVHGRRSERA